MRTEDEIRDRIDELERYAHEYNAGAGEPPHETVAELNALYWVLEEE